MRARHAGNSYECTTRLIVTGTKALLCSLGMVLYRLGAQRAHSPHYTPTGYMSTVGCHSVDMDAVDEYLSLPVDTVDTYPWQGMFIRGWGVLGF